MEEKKNITWSDIKKGCSNWWEKNGKVVKGIAITGVVAGLYGYAKGCLKSNEMTRNELLHLYEKIPTPPLTPDTPLEDILEGHTRQEIEDLMADMIWDGRMEPK